MNQALEYPKLRWPIDIRLEKLPQQEVLVLSCPLGIAPAPLGLMPAVGPILGSFDGTLSIDQICEKFSRYQVQRPMVEELVRILDEHLFLASPRFFAAEKTVREDFRLSKLRPAALAGAGYSADPDSLRGQIDGYLESAKNHSTSPRQSGELAALVAPHIDYRRGSMCYGMTYQHLLGQQHDLYVILGTAHQYSQRLFHLTAKDFATPLGTMRHDADFVTRLAAGFGGERAFADEFLHRREHSIELQLPFLARLNPEASIVPVLVGSFHRLLQGTKQPNDCEEYESFVTNLTSAAAERNATGAKICFVAGIDLAHVGKNFGDSEALTEDRMSTIAERDRELLDIVSRQDKSGLLQHIAEDGDARRVCGFPPLYTLLDVLERLNGQHTVAMFDYRQAVDFESDCAVTFAGLGFYRSG